MTEYELKNFIIAVVRQTLAPILMGEVVENDSPLFGQVKNVGKASPISARSVLPYGYSTRAPAGTPGLLVPIAGDPSHVNVVGHADSARPDVGEGEVALYNQFGQTIYLANGKIHFGTKGAAHPAVLGDVFQNFASQLLEILATHTHAGPGSPPTEAAQFEQLKSSPIGDNSILSDQLLLEK